MAALHLRAQVVDCVDERLFLHADEQQRKERGEEDASHNDAPD